MTEPRFARPLHVAQVNLPDEDDVIEAFRGIFERQYFTNNGPLLRAFDQALAESLGIRHAVCVVNGTVALMAALQALLASRLGPRHRSRRPEVIVPSFTFPATVQAISWAGAEPVFCDVDRQTHCVDSAFVEPLIGENTAGILAVHTWGRPADVRALETLAERHGLFLLFDSAHAIGCEFDGRLIGGFGHAEVFSLHATKIVQALEGGVVTTNDDGLAAHLRKLRAFHPAEEPHTPLRMNAKMSEAQAAFGLLSLRDMPANIEANRQRYGFYRDGLEGAAGLKLYVHEDGWRSNFQYVILENHPEITGRTRDWIVDSLTAENVLARRHFNPCGHQLEPYADVRQGPLDNTRWLSERTFQLPNGQDMTPDDIAGVCALVRELARPG